MVVLVVKNLPANSGDARDMSSILGSGKAPEEGNGNPLQASILAWKILRTFVTCNFIKIQLVDSLS